MTVKIKVISPEKIVWDTDAEQIVLPSITGGLGILDNHAPLVSVLQAGLLKQKKDDTWVPLVLWGGVAQVENNEIVVLANGVEEFSSDMMTRDEADKQVLNLLETIEEIRESSEPDDRKLKKLMQDAEIAKARVEGLALIN